MNRKSSFDIFAYIPIFMIFVVALARTLLECIEVDYVYPWNDGGGD